MASIPNWYLQVSNVQGWYLGQGRGTNAAVAAGVRATPHRSLQESLDVLPYSAAGVEVTLFLNDALDNADYDRTLADALQGFPRPFRTVNLHIEWEMTDPNGVRHGVTVSRQIAWGATIRQAITMAQPSTRAMLRRYTATLRFFPSTTIAKVKFVGVNIFPTTMR